MLAGHHRQRRGVKVMVVRLFASPGKKWNPAAAPKLPAAALVN